MVSKTATGVQVAPEFRDILPANSPFWEKCARHQTAQTARTMQFLYLCDNCAIRLTKEALNARPPIYHGETINGYCGLCNELLFVTLRSYFMCPFCWNVIVAYQKAFVAAKAVHEYWKRSVSPEIPDLRLRETEAVYLSPYSRSGKSKRAAATELSALDFVVEKTNSGKTAQLFHLELKAGPGSIDEMSEFQLDINDSNDIIGVVNNTHLPAYIFHVQLFQEYVPPTRKTVAGGVWFTDIHTLMANQLSVRRRRGDQKDAGYYTPSAFRRIDDFVGLLRAKHYQTLSAALSSNPLELT